MITDEQMEIRKRLQLAADCYYTKENLERKLTESYSELGINKEINTDVILTLYHSERRKGFFGDDYIYIIDYKKEF